jgi:hypothetical protein
MAALHRIVLMRFSSEPDEAEIRSLLAAVQEQVEGVVAIRFGRNRADGSYTHGIHAEFADAEALETYLPHPAHQALGAYLRSKGLEYELLIVSADDVVSLAQRR